MALIPGKHNCPKCGATPLYVQSATLGVNWSGEPSCSVCSEPMINLVKMLVSYDIRVPKLFDNWVRNLHKKTVLDPDTITLTIDPNITIPMIMIHTGGQFQLWSSGKEHVKSFLLYGYVDIRKACPFRHRKCIGERCSLSVLRNGTRDCAHVWTVIMK